MKSKREISTFCRTLWEDEDGADRDPDGGDASGGRRFHDPRRRYGLCLVNAESASDHRGRGRPRGHRVGGKQRRRDDQRAVHGIVGLARDCHLRHCQHGLQCCGVGCSSQCAFGVKHYFGASPEPCRYHPRAVDRFADLHHGAVRHFYANRLGRIGCHRQRGAGNDPVDRGERKRDRPVLHSAAERDPKSGPDSAPSA